MSFHSNDGVTRMEIVHILVEIARELLRLQGLEFELDHRLVVATLKLHLKKPKTSASIMKKLD